MQMKQILITISAVLLVGCGDTVVENEEQEFQRNLKKISDEIRERDKSLSDASRGLLESVKNENIEDVKKFLASGADVNSKSDVATPLNLAAVERNIDIVELLIANGANSNVKDIQGYTPLHRAAFDGHKEIAELLIANGAELNVKNGWHSTPLVEAVLGNQVELVKLLISKGADVNLVDNRMQTALDRVSGPVGTGNNEIADLLRKHGSKTGQELKAESTNAMNQFGWTKQNHNEKQTLIKI